MRLAVFGATGGTGARLTRQALERGHEVAVLARRPQALGIDHPRLRVVAGDVTVPGAAAPVVAGADAVVSALGIGLHRYATTVYSAGVANILAAMAAGGPGRILVVSTSSLSLPGRERLAEWLLARLVLHPLLRKPYADMRVMEDELGTSDAAWTIVRAARLTNGPPTGTWRVAESGKLPGCWSISRADLASYLLDHVADPSLARTTVDIAY
ncbi:MAG TPA: NAD(P)H-binding protein [Trebonia sp.]|jgi:putative NADH-flavin reductase|nr:NAD(P)H-binding protein [Trebonia sp.]